MASVALDFERNNLQQTRKHLFQENTVSCVGKTIRQDIRDYHVIAKDSYSNAHGKCLLGFAKGGAQRIAVRSNVLNAQVENAVSAVAQNGILFGNEYSSFSSILLKCKSQINSGL